ncbi:hypothetical protein [Variovorax sp. GT1P44]|uniref:hypothetical protein n=1 Tax=Variovorax sp. GT1P44 TaxID=3443742 RepID=UPI003F44E79C
MTLYADDRSLLRAAIAFALYSGRAHWTLLSMQEGAVQFNALSKRTLDYLFALALLGRDYGCPAVVASRRRG